MTAPAPQQLHMIWPEGHAAPPVEVPDGYDLRTFRHGDEAGYLAVLHAAGFEQFDESQLKLWLTRVLPDGLFVAVERATVRVVQGAAGNIIECATGPIVDCATGRVAECSAGAVMEGASGHIVGTALAAHNPLDLHPFGGELGYVAVHPDHRGRRLGRALCAAVVRRFLQAGYRRIYLRTDDWRLPAIRTYLSLGFVPLLHAPDMHDRWRIVCQQLRWPFTPDAWPSTAPKPPSG